jgi:hypothetical protein
MKVKYEGRLIVNNNENTILCHLKKEFQET